ncbi:hypothetical protein VE03_10350 [Pseudogymnoascus sp. 23342-1-I1]|nr:hypothetical protein VE03_10350 [Pseudogymnoascus sp. 23342-1-I1]
MWSTVIPQLMAITVWVLTLLCIRAGTKPGYLQGYSVYNIYMSTVCAGDYVNASSPLTNFTFTAPSSYSKFKLHNNSTISPPLNEPGNFPVLIQDVETSSLTFGSGTAVQIHFHDQIFLCRKPRVLGVCYSTISNYGQALADSVGSESDFQSLTQDVSQDDNLKKHEIVHLYAVNTGHYNPTKSTEPVSEGIDMGFWWGFRYQGCWSKKNIRKFRFTKQWDILEELELSFEELELLKDFAF